MKKLLTRKNYPCSVNITKKDDYYTIHLYDVNTLDEACYICFTPRSNSYTCQDTAWLHKIQICNDQYSHKGIGSLAMNLMERYLIDSRVKYINGKFYPEGDLGIYSRKFYNNLGYDIQYEGYSQELSKHLEETQYNNFDFNILDLITDKLGTETEEEER